MLDKIRSFLIPSLRSCILKLRVNKRARSLRLQRNRTVVLSLKSQYAPLHETLPFLMPHSYFDSVKHYVAVRATVFLLH